MHFVSIPAGSFMMGCSAEDHECYAEEKPTHRVSITRPFEMGKYQVTQAEYEAVMASNPSYSTRPKSPRRRRRAGKTHRNFVRRSTARETDTTIACRQRQNGNMQHAAEIAPAGTVRWMWLPGSETIRVERRIPSVRKSRTDLDCTTHWGTSGNRSGAGFRITYYGRSPEFDPKGPVSGEYRVSRGGSFRGLIAGGARVSSRYIQKPNVRSIVIGFRCVRELVR